MTKTHHKSNDGLVEIITTTDDDRFPRHDAPMAVMKIRPQPHTRVREQWGCVTLMVKYSELRALAEAVALCDKNFTFSMTKSAQNKPQSRERWWLNRNKQRVIAKLSHARR